MAFTVRYSLIQPYKGTQSEIQTTPLTLLKHSEYFMCHHLQPTQCIDVFCMHLQQRAIISLHRTRRQVLTIQTECVYCAVRTESLNTVQVFSYTKR